MAFICADTSSVRSATGSLGEYNQCDSDAVPDSCYRSPAGVLRALKRVAKYIENGKELHLSGVGLMSSAKPYETPYKG